MPDILELIGNADEDVYAVDSEQKIILGWGSLGMTTGAG